MGGMPTRAFIGLRGPNVDDVGETKQWKYDRTMRSKHRVAVLFFLVALGATGLSERTFAEDSIVVNTRQLAIGSPATILVRAFAGNHEFLGASSPVSVYLDRRLIGTTPYLQSSIVAGSWIVAIGLPLLVSPLSRSPHAQPLRTPEHVARLLRLPPGIGHPRTQKPGPNRPSPGCCSARPLAWRLHQG